MAWKYCEKMADLLGEDAEVAMLTLSEHNSGIASLLLGEFDRAIGHFDRVLELRPQAELSEINRYYPADPATVDRAMRCWAGALNGQPRAEILAELEQVIAVMRAETNEFSRCYALAIIATIYCTLDDAENARLMAREAHAISLKIKFQYWEAWSSIVLGWAEARCDEQGAGITILRDGLERYLATGSTQILSFSKTLLADAYLARGEVAEAEALIAETRDMLNSSATGFHTTMTDQVAARIAQARVSGSAGS